MIELKPCPFCGGEAYFDKDDNGWQWIECGKCHVATNQRASLMEDCKPLLAEAWNARSSIDSEAIRRKFWDELHAEAIRREFWDELHAEAEAQYDHRHDVLRPVKTYAQSMIVHTMDDGWSAWLLAKKIIDDRREAEAKAREATL